MVEYDPTHQVGITAAGAVVVVVRDPDASNEYRAWTKRGGGGVVYALDIDAGADDLGDPDTYEAWAEGFHNIADELDEAGWKSAAGYVWETVESYNPEAER